MRETRDRTEWGASAHTIDGGTEKKGSSTVSLLEPESDAAILLGKAESAIRKLAERYSLGPPESQRTGTKLVALANNITACRMKLDEILRHAGSSPL